MRTTRLYKIVLSLIIAAVVLFSGCSSVDLPEISFDDLLGNGSEEAVEDEPSVPETETVPDDYDHDGITDSIEEQLIDRFAPVIRFHEDEDYFPADIAWYLSRVRMRFDIPFGFDKQVLDHGEVTPDSLLIQELEGEYSGYSEETTSFFLEQADIDGHDTKDDYRLATREGTGPEDWICYARVRPSVPGTSVTTVDIQYIIFYTYNGDTISVIAESAHEGDFEHITVRVNADLTTINKIYYAAHDDEGSWYSLQSGPGILDGYEMTADGRPIVYVSDDSHASYPWAGKWERKFLPDDHTSNSGIEWDCRDETIRLGEIQYPTDGNEWLQYSGRWGEIGEFSFTKGPYGPAYQDWWDGE